MKVLYLAVCSTPGYYGTSCNIPCPPGTFGRGCAGNCSVSCPFEICHHEFGCPQEYSSVPKPTQSGLKQLLSLSCMYFTVVYNSKFTITVVNSYTSLQLQENDMFSQEHPVKQIESCLPEPLTVPVSFYNYTCTNTIGIVFKSYFHLLYVNSF